MAFALPAGLDEHLTGEPQVGGQLRFGGKDAAHSEVAKAAVRFLSDGNTISIAFQRCPRQSSLSGRSVAFKGFHCNHYFQ